jgi:putative colanic acid biosynthesis acetyltransferase WcaF
MQPVVQSLSAFKVPEPYTNNRLTPRLVLWFFLGDCMLRSWLPGSMWRRALLRCFGAVIGSKVVIKPHVRVKYPWRLCIGDYSWIGEHAWIDNLDWVRIGANVCVSQGAYLCTGNHDYRDTSFPYRLGAINVESEAWICAMSSLAPGVTVGRGAILGLGSVATSSLNPMTRYQGNPAVPIGFRIHHRVA